MFDFAFQENQIVMVKVFLFTFPYTQIIFQRCMEWHSNLMNIIEVIKHSLLQTNISFILSLIFKFNFKFNIYLTSYALSFIYSKSLFQNY